MNGPALPRGYEAVRVLGAGGYGEVVLATQTSLGRPVAVKRIHGHLLTGPDELARFRREARVLAALDAPTVVRVHDFIDDGRAAFLVMEHVPGRSLADVVADGGLPVAGALQVLGDVAEALRTAAAQGVVHRDVKPGNVFVLPDGRAKLGDFGLARVVADPAVFRTSDGTVSATPAYFAPETGVTEPDARSDAYSFGVMAFEVLTGRLPFDADDPTALIAAHLYRRPPRADEVLPGLPPAAADALDAALSKDPAQRPLPWELVERLRAVPASAWPGAPLPPVRRAPETVPVLPPAAQQPVPNLPRRSGGRRRLLLAAGLVLAAALAGAALLADRRQPSADEPLAVTAVRVAVDPADGVGRCPAQRFEFTATVETNGGAGTLRSVWVRPDGREAEPSTLDVSAGQRRVTVVLAVDVSGELPLSGAASLRVLEPAPQSASSPPVQYSC